MNDRVLVAGGGGGGGEDAIGGGGGGGLTGGSDGAAGGTQTSGGAGGGYCPSDGPGTFGLGGDSDPTCDYDGGGGGGGGGYWGGGGGGIAGGGGGSGFVGATGGTTGHGMLNTGDGSVTITYVQTEAALTLTKTAAAAPLADGTTLATATPPEVMHGQDVVYTLTVSNAGPDTSVAPMVQDTLPAGQTYVATNNSEGCTPTGMTPVLVTCATPDLVALGMTTFTITASTAGIASPLYTPLTQTNNATVTSTTDNPNAPSTAPAMITVVPAADLTLTNVAGDPPLTYTLGNLGPDPAKNPTLVDTLPAGETFDSGGSSSSCSAAGQTVTCAVPTTSEGTGPGAGNYFDAGAHATFQIAVIPATTGPGSTPLTSTATFSSDTADPNLPNNTVIAASVGPLSSCPPETVPAVQYNGYPIYVRR